MHDPQVTYFCDLIHDCIQVCLLLLNMHGLLNWCICIVAIPRLQNSGDSG